MQVLDLDMDYFMNRVAHTGFSVTARLDEEEYGDTVWSEEKVRQFIENNLGLSKEYKIEGRIVEGHNESLLFWEELMHKNKLSAPFSVVHVDSHADLGCGVSGVTTFLQDGILRLNPEMRRKVRCFDNDGKTQGITIGDYLLWGIAYQYFSDITYCTNPFGEKNDYCWDTLKDYSENYIWDKPESNIIQLTFNSKMNLPSVFDTDIYKKKYLDSCDIKDPEVPLLIIPTIEDVSYKGNFDYAVLAQSPNYTPASADFIMDIFREYIYEI